MIIPCIQSKLLPMLLANYAIWPLAHLINFRFVPSQQRILYINAVQVLSDQLQSDCTTLLPWPLKPHLYVATSITAS